MGTLIKYIFVLCITGAAVSVFPACRSDHKNSAPGASTSDHATPAATLQNQNTVPGGLSVRILPESPSAISSFQAVSDYKGGSAVTYLWERNNQVIAGEQGSILNAGNQFSKGDRISVTVRVDGLTASSSAIIGNSSPTVASVTLKPEIIYRGVDITAVPVGSDPDGDYVQFNYKWSINGEEIAENSAVLPGDKFKRGDRVSVAVTPSDADSAGTPFVTRPIVIPNAPPRFTSLPTTSFSGETYTYNSHAEDPDEDHLTYMVVSGPQGMSIDPDSGVLTMKIENVHAGTHQIEIAAQDPQGSKANQKYSLSISIP